MDLVGNDELSQDAVMEQVFRLVDGLLKKKRLTRHKGLTIRSYRIIPLETASGVIEFLNNCQTLGSYLRPAHKKYYPHDLDYVKCRTVRWLSTVNAYSK